MNQRIEIDPLEIWQAGDHEFVVHARENGMVYGHFCRANACCATMDQFTKFTEDQFRRQCECLGFERVKSNAELQASLGAIHYHASRPHAADKTGMLAQMASIVDECERCIPDLRSLRPNPNENQS